MTVFHSTRHFVQSPTAVYAALATPDRLKRWWGPAGFTNTFRVCDIRPGGTWVLTMHGPDGKDYHNVAEFLEVEPDRKMVIRHSCAPYFTLTIHLTAEDGGTRVTWEQAFDSAEVAAAVRPIVEPANEQNLDRWQSELVAGD